MIKIHTTKFAHKWLYWVAAGLLVAYVGHHVYEARLGAQAPAAESTDAFGSLLHRDPSQGAVVSDAGGATAVPLQNGRSAEGTDHTSTALDTGMEDWKKPENVALHAELQRWYDHRDETSLPQRRADASALMAKVEAQQAAGKINQTSAALAKLMLLQGAPSDDPQHAERLQQVMSQLSGQLSFGE